MIYQSAHRGDITLIATYTVEVYTVDLGNVEGEGDFPCPKCGTILTPDEVSEENYTVVDVKCDREDLMVEMTIQCLKCETEIRLTGFIELKENW